MHINRNEIKKAMSDQERHKKPNNEESSMEEDIDSLSVDEKAAFEKIMAEIASGGESPLATDVPGNVEEGLPNSAVPPAPEPQEGDSTAMVAPGDSPDAETGEEGDPDGLNDEQQAALDQIMADINSQDAGGQPAAEEAPVQQDGSSPEDGSLSADQQAALDKIMAEINGQTGDTDEPSQPEADPSSSSSDEAMSDDQQAALEQIMAEIESKKGGRADDTKEGQSDDPDASLQDSPDSRSAESLPDDQQAALDQIMAEIESKRNRSENSPESGNNAGGTDPYVDQDAELEAVMDQIARSKPANRPAQSGTESSAKVNLSMEEFDDELSQLLSSSDGKSASPEEVPDSEDESASAAAGHVTSTSTDNHLAQPGGANQLEAESEDQELATSTEDQSQIPVAPSAAKSVDDYPILQEVNPETQHRNSPSTAKPALRYRAAPHTTKSGKHRFRNGFLLLLIVSVVAGGAYWAYVHKYSLFAKKPIQRAAPEQTYRADQKQAPATNAIGESTPARPQPTPAAVPSAMPAADADPLVTLKTSLTQAREALQAKMASIEDLKAYYQKGIEEDLVKLRTELNNQGIGTYDKAVADKKIELIMRSIQRRMAYTAKLNTPLRQLQASSEGLLYLERRAQLFEALVHQISGLPVAQFKTEVREAVDRQLRENNRLSIDEVQVQIPSLKDIWKQRGAQGIDKTRQKVKSVVEDPRNLAVGQEICQGQYENKYQLTELSAETAKCLLQWGGRDMYLNALRHLPPAAAKILAQWPGESLSLNGLTELPDESAKYIAQWPGKHLSLNGLIQLSPQATAYLSQWKGEQLEMVGLQSIGRWENYGTHLFLSEKLRRQLERQ